jgi:hypothetical protein
MPEFFYFFLSLSSIAGFLLIGIVIARIGRRRNSRRISEELQNTCARKRRKKITECGLSE